MTTFAEMKGRVLWTFGALLSFASGLLMPYCEGRSNSWWAIPPLPPADLLPVLVLFVACAVLLSSCVRSVLSRRRVVTTAWLFCICLTLLVVRLGVRPADLFHRGFHHYAKSVLTADEWRSISRVAQERLRPEGRLPGPRKNLWDEKEHRALWVDLCGTTQIQKLDPSLMILVRAQETEIVWGGALTGHRGVVIFTGSPAEDQRSRWSATLFITDDIATFVSAD
jgi:hypothetical protein